MVHILDNKQPAIPLIKVIFSLATPKSELRVVKHPPSDDYKAIVYEIWSGGLLSHHLAPVKVGQDEVWKSLLQASYEWQNIYRTPTNIQTKLRQSMNPSASSDPGHWCRWVEDWALFHSNNTFLSTCISTSSVLQNIYLIFTVLHNDVVIFPLSCCHCLSYVFFSLLHIVNSIMAPADLRLKKWTMWKNYYYNKIRVDKF